MNYLLLKETYDELHERLDKYFDDNLMKEPRAKADLENHKVELLQNLTVELWVHHNSETYKSYHPETFIWLKAKKVWIDFARKLSRENSHKSKTDINDLTQMCAEDFLLPFEQRDALTVVESLLSAREIQLWHYRAEGFSYKEIVTMTDFPTEDAAKAKFNRMKKFIRLRFRRF